MSKMTPEEKKIAAKNGRLRTKVRHHAWKLFADDRHDRHKKEENSIPNWGMGSILIIDLGYTKTIMQLSPNELAKKYPNITIKDLVETSKPRIYVLPKHLEQYNAMIKRHKQENAEHDQKVEEYCTQEYQRQGIA
jgi:hypothetical protein